MKRLLSLLIVAIFCFQVFCFGDSARAESQKNPKQGNAMILVRRDNEKSLYDNLVLREQNFDFSIDVISLQEKKINADPQKIHDFLWSQKDKYKYFVLDELIPYGPFQNAMMSDYYYAFPTDYNTYENFFWNDKESADEFGGTVEHYPVIIVSRIKRSQIKFYSEPQRKAEKKEALIALPPVFHNRTAVFCGVGSWHTELSYTGDFYKNILVKKDIKTTTMYDTRSQYVLSETDKRNSKIKPLKKPDIPLTSENFIKESKSRNFFLLFNTAEPLPNEKDVVFYPNEFTTSYWVDSNKDGNAQNSEITVEKIQPFSQIKSDLFSFVFAPMPYKISNIDVPLLITQPFEFYEAPKPRTYIGYFVGNDPESSSATTYWNGILKNISEGMTFAEANLLGYTTYFKVINKRDDDFWSQAINATKLVFFGLPWYNIDSLTSGKPEMQIKQKVHIGINGQVDIPIKNNGNKDLILNFSHNGDLNAPSQMTIVPGEEKKLSIKISANRRNENSNNSESRQFKILKYKTKLQIETNDPSRPQVEIEIEFWFFDFWLSWVDCKSSQPIFYFA